MTSGYASFDYEIMGHKEGDLVKLGILVNSEPVDALAMMVHKDFAQAIGRDVCEKLKDLIPRHNFMIPVQAAIGGKIIARETIKGFKKDVLTKIHGGGARDRKRKLLDKQKKGRLDQSNLEEWKFPKKHLLECLKLIKKIKMIYDCFSYWDEDLLLELRLNILDKIVDRFVIVEGNKTWQNNSKSLRFDVEKFQKFKNKIIYIPVTDLPDGEDPYLKKIIKEILYTRGIKNAKDDDIILISDLDEIPNPNSIKNFNPKMRYATFQQKHFYYKFNLQIKIYPLWNGTIICVKKYL